jgi:ankyrin repeat protein
MKKVNPKLIIALVAVIFLSIYIKASNPYRKYSAEQFWVSATVEDVYKIPDEALLPGNKNGSVLMWASMATQDPKIIAALVSRGADVNESDIVFSGTPLSSAAGSNSNPEIIHELIRLGAEINKVVGSNNKTPLIIAAELNPSPEIIESLVQHGADVKYKDLTGRTALEQAVIFRNYPAINALQKHLM